jgi:hypothetical protein
MSNDLPKTLHNTDASLPAVYHALLAFNRAAARMLKEAKLPGEDVSFVRRRTRKAILSLGEAIIGHRRSYHLKLADAAISSCVDLFRLFRSEDSIDGRTYESAYHLIQQIRKGLAVLSRLPHDQWSTATLPPVEVQSDDPATPKCGSWYDLIGAGGMPVSSSSEPTNDGGEPECGDAPLAEETTPASPDS